MDIEQKDIRPHAEVPNLLHEIIPILQDVQGLQFHHAFDDGFHHDDAGFVVFHVYQYWLSIIHW